MGLKGNQKEDIVRGKALGINKCPSIYMQYLVTYKMFV